MLMFIDMKVVVKHMIDYKVNYISGVPTWTNLLFSNMDNQVMPDMKYVICGGEVASFAMVKRIATGGT
jgi:hypothetical protein